MTVDIGKRPHGFTLIELLIAVAVFAVMSLMVYGSLTSVMSVRNQTDAVSERLSVLQRTFLMLERDLEQAVKRTVRDESGITLATFLSPEIGDYRLEFVKGGYQNTLPGQFPRSTLQRVAYRLNQDKQLVRTIWPDLDRPLTYETIDYPLVEGVEELNLRFLDTADEWQPHWPPPNIVDPRPSQLLMPKAVELELVLKNVGSIKRLFVISGS